MQTPVDKWFSWFLQPAIVLGGIGLFLRLVLWPALKNLMRTELKDDLDRLAGHEGQLRTLATQTEANTRALVALEEVPITLARIEENMKTLMRRGSPRD